MSLVPPKTFFSFQIFFSQKKKKKKFFPLSKKIHLFFFLCSKIFLSKKLSPKKLSNFFSFQKNFIHPPPQEFIPYFSLAQKPFFSYEKNLFRNVFSFLDLTSKNIFSLSLVTFFPLFKNFLLYKKILSSKKLMRAKKFDDKKAFEEKKAFKEEKLRRKTF